MKKIVVIIVFLLSLYNLKVSAELTNNAQTAIYQLNIPKMIKAADQTPENEKAVLIALSQEVDLREYSYEQLNTWLFLSGSQNIKNLLSQIVANKEVEILQYISNLTAEEINAYIYTFPFRKKLVYEFLDSTLLPNLNHLSLFELMYYDDYLPQEYHEPLNAEIMSRAQEISVVLKKNFTDYNNLEKVLSERLKYLIEYTLWTYFVEGHKALNKAYSEIGIAPDNAFIAEEQYQNLVRKCFPTKKIQEQLQKEVDSFLVEINRARAEYYHALGEKTYPKLSYKVPTFTINSNASIDPLWKIGEARERFIRDRESVSTGTSVLGWIFGGFVGLVAQGIGDWMVIDDLVSAEFSARKEYMNNVQKKLLTSFANYSNTVIAGVKKTI